MRQVPAASDPLRNGPAQAAAQACGQRPPTGRSEAHMVCTSAMECGLRSGREEVNLRPQPPGPWDPFAQPKFTRTAHSCIRAGCGETIRTNCCGLFRGPIDGTMCQTYRCISVPMMQIPRTVDPGDSYPALHRLSRVLMTFGAGARAQGASTLGIGGGQPYRVNCVRIAAERAGDNVRGAVRASDAFFPFPRCS
jgi:hypothetical protein